MGDQRKGRQEKADEEKKRVVCGLEVPSQRILRRVRGHRALEMRCQETAWL